MEFFPETAWYLEALFNGAMAVLPTLAVVAATGELGARVIKSTRKAWKTIRPGVDEADDLAVQYIAKITGRDPQDVRDFLVSAGDQIAAIMPEKTTDPSMRGLPGAWKQ